MENNSIFLSQKKFDEIWKRVTTSEPHHDDKLTAFLNDEFADYTVYKTLSLRFSGEMRLLFAQMANDEMRHYRMLSGAYYILAGEKFIPEKQKKLTFESLPQLLKDRYYAELKSASSYLKTSENTEDELSFLYKSAAEDEKSHARTILYILGGLVRQNFRS